MNTNEMWHVKITDHKASPIYPDKYTECWTKTKAEAKTIERLAEAIIDNVSIEITPPKEK